MRTFLFWALVFMLATLGACSTQPASFYTLGVMAAREDAYPVRTASVVVTSVTVPDIVDRPQFVIRVSDNEVKLDEFARWADPVKSQIPHVIAGDLAILLPGARVSVFPQNAESGASYSVRVELQRFEGAPGDAATIEALWTVIPPKGAASINGHTLAREPAAGSGNQALAAAYSSALGAVSRDIAAAIHASLSKYSLDTSSDRKRIPSSENARKAVDAPQRLATCSRSYQDPLVPACVFRQSSSKSPSCFRPLCITPVVLWRRRPERRPRLDKRCTSARLRR